jgi:inorganic pyrophosphatase
MLGRIVTVIVDRPLGSAHPKYPSLIYPVNYGYVPDVIAPDGEEQDVYILGVDTPIDIFTGKIIAVIRRKNDVEDKWVVAPEGMTFSQEKIEELTRFQERHFDSEVII